MATIYRFIVEQKVNSSGDGRTPRESTGKGAGKRKTISLFGGEKGGVEHNRKLRAINPLLNRATGGWWEKGMRIGRAGLGLIQVDKKTGKFAGFSGPAVAIIIAFIIQTLLKWQRVEMIKAEKLNAQNYKQLENGIGAVHGQYKITANFWTGRHTYNQNK